MRFVKQKHVTGCGIATLSMVTGIGYDRMLKLVHPKRKTGDCACTSIVDFLKVIEKLKLKCNVSFRKRSLTNISGPAIVAVKTLSGNYHAVAWDPDTQKVIDPWGDRKRGKSYKIDVPFCKKNMQYLIEII